MNKIKEKIIHRLPSIISTKSGFLKLNDDQKEALAARLEMFFQVELASAHEEGVQYQKTQLPPINLN